MDLGATPDRVLFQRLKEHAGSIEQTANLRLEDFFCRYLVVDEIWIPLAEQLLIEKFAPVWNHVVAGFGIHAPGSGRSGQRRSLWDVIHPGRKSAAELPENIRSEEEILKEAAAFLAEKYPD